MTAIYDKTGREIMVGDVLKVFHYTAALRRKRCYMYKQVLEQVELGKRAAPYFKIGHLTFDPLEYYYQLLDDRTLADYEIVQGIKADWEDRPRKAHPLTNSAGKQET
jgi:hypothetical protein